ncbi:hypothetical protein QVD17_30310 [Tagetes erecta]|uniref:Phytosulfokine n=1 Tax=Tagetes erecta TaxID=13708 RepID=A0AAD8K1B0_TARER|nr:hypothetical protein QVD17_30310 [Tagetes erecta]
MSKTISLTTLCMLAILLFSMLSFTTARPIPTFKGVTPFESHNTEEEVTKASAIENCSGEEECLMRRTLAAHLDYIYTKKNQP